MGVQSQTNGVAQPPPPPVEKPKFVNHLQNLAFLVGEAAAIKCVVDSSPDSEIKFYRNGSLIESSEKYSISFDHETGLCSLHIKSASLEDSGQYACVIANAAGTESSNCWIVVRGIICTKIFIN